MDDLKLYAENDEKLNELVQTVHNFSKDICMEFGLDKCSKCTIRKGKKVEAQHLDLEDGTQIEDLEADTTYKYLGIEENSNIEHKLMRKKIHAKYIQRVKSICKTELTTKNKITAINQLAVPVVTYGFGIIDWPQRDINNLDVKTRKQLTLHKLMYRNQCMDSLYIPRSEGGFGLTQINQSFRSTIVSLGQYLTSNKDPLIKKVAKQHKEQLPQNVSILKMASKFGPGIMDDRIEGSATLIARFKRKEHGLKERGERTECWRKNKRAGKFQEELDKCYIDKQASLKWLKDGRLGYNYERGILAAQDQALMTNGFKKMAGLSQDDQCRFCHEAVESGNHLVSGYKILLADGHYTKRHNKVCRYLHWSICKEYNIETKPVWLHEPAMTTAQDDIVIFYDKPLHCGRYIDGGAIKPDIVVWHRTEKWAKIIEVSVPNDFGLNRVEREKQNKYQDLKHDLRDTWDLEEIEIIPVIIGATGLVKKNLSEHLQNIPGNPQLPEVQLSAIKGTISIIKRALGHFS